MATPMQGSPAGTGGSDLGAVGRACTLARWSALAAMAPCARRVSRPPKVAPSFPKVRASRPSKIKPSCAPYTLTFQHPAALASRIIFSRRGSPLSHAVTWEMLRRSAHLSLQQCLELEFALVGRFVAGGADFIEGVRALLIDKDGAPKWRYGSVRDVPQDVVRAMFEGPSDEPPLFGGLPASPTSKM